MPEIKNLNDLVAEVKKMKAEAAAMKKSSTALAELQKRVQKASVQLKKSGKEFAEAEE